MSEKWKSVTSEPFYLEKEGDGIEGTLVDVRDGNFFRPDGSRSKVYEIETSDGSRKTLFGSMVLERLMKQVQIGSKVKIVYRGTIRTKSGRMAKSYDVYVA